MCLLLRPSLSNLKKQPSLMHAYRAVLYILLYSIYLDPRHEVFFFHFFVPYYRNECIHGCLVSSSIQLLFQQAAEISTSRMLNVHERRLKRTHNSTNVWSLQSTSFFTILSTVSEVILLYWYHTFQLLSFKLFKIF